MPVSRDNTRGWPAVQFETLPWEINEAIPSSRSALRRHRGPYRAAVLSPIADRDLLLPPDLAAGVEDDRASEAATGRASGTTSPGPGRVGARSATGARPG